MLTTTKIIILTTASDVIYMTIYDRDLLINGQVYRSDLVTDAVNMHSFADFRTDKAEITMVRDDGHYLNGKLEIYDYDLNEMRIIEPAHFMGTITHISRYDSTMQLEAQSSKRYYNKSILRNYGRSCQAIWGDSRCGIQRHDYRLLIEVEAIEDNQIIYTILEGNILDFHAAYLEDFLGHHIPIMDHDPLLRRFRIEQHYAFNLGQRYHLYAGCQKTPENCKKYNNFANYLGFF